MNGLFYLADKDSTVRTVSWPGSGSIGLTISGNVVNNSTANTIIRTIGDLELAAGASVHGSGLVALSAENGTLLNNASFHNYNLAGAPSVTAGANSQLFIFSTDPALNVPPDPTQVAGQPFFYHFGNVVFFYGQFHQDFLIYQNLAGQPQNQFVFANPPTQFVPEASKFFIDLLKLPTPRAFQFEGTYGDTVAKPPKTWVWTSSFKVPNARKSDADGKQAPRKLLGAAFELQPLPAAVTLAINR